MLVCPATHEFLHSRIDHIMDLRHPSALLASCMPWEEIETRMAQVLVLQVTGLEFNHHITAQLEVMEQQVD